MQNTPSDSHPKPASSRKTVHSLERGIEIIRAFRVGYDLIGNSELAERTGLSRSTVSRLTQTLCSAGILEHDKQQRAYRLGAPVLCFAHAMRNSNPILKYAVPLMRATSEKHHVNVGIAKADRDEMVYLESIRYHAKSALRNIVSGQRIPIELTSLGHAYLSTIPESMRKEILTSLTLKKHTQELQWHSIQRSMESVWLNGYCILSWQPEIIALSTPISIANHATYIMNISLSTKRPIGDIEKVMSPILLGLKREVINTLEKSHT
ncbi:IclR family transcriptional regulator [Halomonas campaniensis]|jgi:DNA-binding IclR family transcriptional regulator|uniref:IclR family transcriptional regulator n=1 Tax=Halomonas campaniensis TaxID=213554 RepID=A0A246S330_9GAMM|nr:helix-turn-helix domain-containing protein [Halomonas campaniensis]OWV30260.1 hypothetical protein JI62_07625 [Halomonas campaniensis]